MLNESARKALFILHEGIGSTIFNSQVVEHVHQIQSKDIQFDILAYETLEKCWTLSKNNQRALSQSYPNINIILKRAVNIYYPFSVLINAVILISFLVKNRKKYSFIHARADYTTFLCVLTKPLHKLPVYWDCRGDSVSELIDSLSRKRLLVRTLGYIYLVQWEQFRVKVNAKMADGAVFVSDALFKLFQKRLSTKNYEIIPCPVSESIFFYDPQVRQDTRDRLGIAPDKTVFLYSGSMIAYQSLEEQYPLYKAILENHHNILIIATSEPDKARSFFSQLPQDNLIITSVKFNEMNLYYNAADFAFLIRDKKQLNYVASPTKFGEYCLTGLPVIMNDTVDQAYSIAKQLGNYISSPNNQCSSYSDSERQKIANKARSFFSRGVLMDKYLRLYSISNS